MAGESGVASYVRTSKQRDGRTPDLSRDYTRSPEKPVEYTSPVIGYSVYLRERITSSNLHGETPWEGCWQTKLCWNCPCEICGWPLVVVSYWFIYIRLAHCVTQRRQQSWYTVHIFMLLTSCRTCPRGPPWVSGEVGFRVVSAGCRGPRVEQPVLLCRFVLPVATMEWPRP